MREVVDTEIDNLIQKSKFIYKENIALYKICTEDTFEDFFKRLTYKEKVEKEYKKIFTSIFKSDTFSGADQNVLKEKIKYFFEKINDKTIKWDDYVKTLESKESGEKYLFFQMADLLNKKIIMCAIDNCHKEIRVGIFILIILILILFIYLLIVLYYAFLKTSNSQMSEKILQKNKFL
jgi:hypothetical protein